LQKQKSQILSHILIKFVHQHKTKRKKPAAKKELLILSKIINNIK